MKKNRTLRRAVSVVCFLALLLALFGGATYVLRNKNSADAVASLYREPEDSLDVVILGSSHILNGAFPMELWHEYGIVSNNLGQHGQSIPLSYYLAEEAIRTQHPDRMVLDAYMLYFPDLVYEEDGNTHKSIDNMAWAGPRLRAIFDLFQGRDRLEYLIPMTLFHSRWKEVSTADFAPADATGKGCEYRLGITPYELSARVPASEKLALAPYALEYFEKLVQLCRDEEVELILVCAPFCADGEKQRYMNAVTDLAREYGLTYWNYLTRLDEMGFDPSSDLYDYSHLNANGALKFTHLLGADLAAAGVPDRRGDPAYAGWEEAYSRWRTRLEEDAAAAAFPLAAQIPARG